MWIKYTHKFADGQKNWVWLFCGDLSVEQAKNYFELKYDSIG
jgi:hypothetical protein